MLVRSHFAQEVVKARPEYSKIDYIPYGGAGSGKFQTIKVMVMHLEKILRKPGDHPKKPRVPSQGS